MKQILIIVLFPISIFLNVQDAVSPDSVLPTESEYSITGKNYLDSLQKKEFEKTLEQNNRNLEQFLKNRKETEKKERRKMILNFAIGIFFLIILFIGLKSKRRKTS